MTVSEYTLSLIRSVIQDENPYEKPDGISFEDILIFAQKHKIENMCFAAIEKLKNKPNDEILKKWKYRCSLNQAQQIVQENEKTILKDAFFKEKITYLPMKGWYLQELYPDKAYRFMSDIDILIHKSDRKKAYDLMHRLGYRGHFSDYGSDDGYFKDPYLHVELHLDMVNNAFGEWYEYYQDIWRKAYIVNDSEYKLNWNDFYIYMVVNFAKDYTTKGTGIRSLLDFYLFRKKYKKELDRTYIKKELKSLKLIDIEKDVICLADKWFGNKSDLSIPDQMRDKIIKDGIYGSFENKEKNWFEKNTKHISSYPLIIRKIVFALQRAFPGFRRMRYKYPVLEEKPFLLPAIWVVRWMKHWRTILKEIAIMKKIK